MAKLKSKHAEHDDIRNEIGVKKLHTTINNGKSGKKLPMQALFQSDEEVMSSSYASLHRVVAKADLFSQKVKLFKTKN